MTLSDALKVISGNVYGFIVCISKIYNVANYNGRTSYGSNYFYWRIRPEGLSRDVERDLGKVEYEQ